MWGFKYPGVKTCYLRESDYPHETILFLLWCCTGSLDMTEMLDKDKNTKVQGEGEVSLLCCQVPPATQSFIYTQKLNKSVFYTSQTSNFMLARCTPRHFSLCFLCASWEMFTAAVLRAAAAQRASPSPPSASGAARQKTSLLYLFIGCFAPPAGD